MGRGIIAGVACFLLAGTASIGSAGAAGSPAKTCGPSYGKTLIAGRSARVYSVIGEHSIVARCLQWSLRRVGSLRRRAQAAPQPAAPRQRIRFPRVATPVVSGRPPGEGVRPE